MTAKFIIAQLIGLGAFAAGFITFQVKSNKLLFTFLLLSNLLSGLSLYLLNGTSGSLTSLIIIARCIILAMQEHKWASWKGWIAILIGANLVTTILSWESPMSLLPFIAATITTFSGWSQDGRIIRNCQLFINSPLWIIYDVPKQAYTGMLTELLSMVSILVYYHKHGWKSRHDPE